MLKLLELWSVELKGLVMGTDEVGAEGTGRGTDEAGVRGSLVCSTIGD